MLRDALPPTLGVTGALSLLWLGAVALDSPDSQAARALDPAIGGSISDIWGVAQLAAVLALALVRNAWGAAMAAALLLAGEAGELHLAVARQLCAFSGLDVAWLKAVAAGSLGAAALALVSASTRPPAAGLLLACGALGSVGLSFDLAQAQLPVDLRSACGSLEEWCEIALASLLAAASVNLPNTGPDLGRVRTILARMQG